MIRVVLHVDRLVLRGFTRAEVPGVSAGLRAELQARLGDDTAVAALSRHQASHLAHAGAVRVPYRGSPEAVGRAVAGRIVRGAGS